MEKTNNMYRRIAASIFSLAVIMVPGYFGIRESVREQNHRDLARKVAMFEYQPVGNGGALSEFHGKISKDRSEMYDRIEETYYQGVETKSTYELKEELKRLESGKPRVDRQLLRERLGE